MLIKTNTRREMVRQERQIHKHISERYESGVHGSSANMKDCFSELEKVSKRGGWMKKDSSVFLR